MTNAAKTLPRQGSAEAVEIYVAVGVALSWWEGSEDMLMALFRTLCAEQEPIAFETYVASPRNRRGEMLKSALRRYEHNLEGDEAQKAVAAIKALARQARVDAESDCTRTLR